MGADDASLQVSKPRHHLGLGGENCFAGHACPYLARGAANCWRAMPRVKAMAVARLSERVVGAMGNFYFFINRMVDAVGCAARFTAEQ